MFKKLNLGAKLNLLLLFIFVGLVAISGLVLSRILEGNAQQEVTSKALMLIETMSSVRSYTDKEITPELASRLKTENHFLAQTVPAYSARQVFEDLRTREPYNNFFYKEATLNPTNLRDKADKFETTIVEQFRNQPGLKELTGFRSTPSGDIFYVARPLSIDQQSCLQCHSTPEAAPKSQLITYGRDNGFNWKLNEIVGARVISVPSTEVFKEARRSQFLVIGILSGVFLVAILLLNLFLKFSIIKPLKQMSQLAKQVSTGNMDGEFEHQANDEIGILAASLNRMKVSLEMAMNMLDQN